MCKHRLITGHFSHPVRLLGSIPRIESGVRENRRGDEVVCVQDDRPHPRSGMGSCPRTHDPNEDAARRSAPGESRVLPISSFVHRT